jgi:hypothetical protein
MRGGGDQRSVYLHFMEGTQVRFPRLTASVIKKTKFVKITALWDIALCSLDVDRRF